MNRATILGLAAVGVVAVSLGAVAQMATPDQQVLTRQLIMRLNGAGAAALAPIGRGDQPWNQQAVVRQATNLRDTASIVPTLFPDGSGPDKVAKSNALPAIWTGKADFAAKAKALEDEAGKLLALAQANNEAGAKTQIAEIGKACNGCHTPYRKPLN